MDLALLPLIAERFSRETVGNRFNSGDLFLLFDVHGVLSQPRRILAQFQLFTAWLTLQGVVVIASFFTDEEDCFRFFLAF